MSHKPSLTRALDTAADIARQIGRDPAVKEATADLLQHVGRKLADKADQGANQLRARNPVDTPVGQPAPALRTSARRVGVVLADAMVRSSASREREKEKAGRHAARPTPHRHGDIENAILQHAEAAYQRVMARFDEPEEASLRHDVPVSPAEAEEEARAWAQVAEQGSSLLASAVGAPVAGASPATRDRRSELSGDDHWHEEPR